MSADVTRGLAPGERVVWEGAPIQGFRFRLIDLANAFLGLMFVAASLWFVVHWFPLGLLIPHLWIGLYFLIGRFLLDAKIRRSTGYAITDTRAIVVTEWPRYRLITVNYRSTPEISLVHHRSGRGTISFGPPRRVFSSREVFPLRPTAFESISDPDQVMQLLHTPEKAKLT
jgi:hypothetical protein